MKYIFYMCKKCGNTVKVLRHGAAVAPEARNCIKCHELMEKSNKREYDKARGYDVLRKWVKDMEKEEKEK